MVSNVGMQDLFFADHSCLACMKCVARFRQPRAEFLDLLELFLDL